MVDEALKEQEELAMRATIEHYKKVDHTLRTIAIASIVISTLAILLGTVVIITSL